MCVRCVHALARLLCPPLTLTLMPPPPAAEVHASSFNFEVFELGLWKALVGAFTLAFGLTVAWPWLRALCVGPSTAAAKGFAPME